MDAVPSGTPSAEAPSPEGQRRSATAPSESLADDGGALHALLDPLVVALAAPARFPAPASELTPRADFVAVVEELVRRISWGGDGRSGAARIELGAGRLRGGSIIVRASGRQVSLELDLPAGFDGRALEQRLRERLGSRGIEVL